MHSPPTVGTPKQLPQCALPATPPLTMRRLRAAEEESELRSDWLAEACPTKRPAEACPSKRPAEACPTEEEEEPTGREACPTWSRRPKRSESMTAMGRAPMVKMSRRMPPTPVAAPCRGSMKLGWLCDSILKAMT